MRLADDSIEFLLDTWPVARLATTGAGGNPHQVPVVFVRQGSRILSPIDGKPKTGRELARVRNIERSPPVSLLLDHYDPDWRLLWWLRLDGRARVLRPAAREGLSEIGAVLDGLRAKYPQYSQTPLLGDPPTLIAIEPTARHSWCASAEAAPSPTGV